jgi:hypothetical protein
MRDLYTAIENLDTKIEKRFEKFDTKIEILEAFKDKWIGYVSALSLVITLTFSFVWKKVFGE